MAMMVFLGIMVKLKITAISKRGFAYRLPAEFSTFSIMINLLVAGHLTVDQKNRSLGGPCSEPFLFLLSH